jgi:hypothetical protein
MGLTVDTRIRKKFKHRVAICRAEDVVIDGQLVFQKRFIKEGWAMIETRRVQTFSQQNQAVFEEKDRRTHFIYMNYDPNLLLSTAAWLYEERRKSPPRWFKILFAGEEHDDSMFFQFDCRLIERGDDIMEPVMSQRPQLGVPAGVML